MEIQIREVTTKAGRKWMSREKGRTTPKEVWTTKEIKEAPLRVTGKLERNFHIEISNPVEYEEKYASN